MKKLNIKKNDTVLVLAGSSKGKKRKSGQGFTKTIKNNS